MKEIWIWILGLLVLVILTLVLAIPVIFAMHQASKIEITKMYIEKGYAKVPVQYKNGYRTSWAMCWVPMTNVNVKIKQGK